MSEKRFKIHVHITLEHQYSKCIEREDDGNIVYMYVMKSVRMANERVARDVFGFGKKVLVGQRRRENDRETRNFLQSLSL